MDSHMTKVPIPVALLAFGLAGLGGLSSHFAGLSAIVLFDALACFALAFLARRIMRYPFTFRAQMRHPLPAAAMSAVLYTLVLMSGHWAKYAPSLAMWAWLTLTALSAVYLVWFTVRFAMSMSVDDVGPSIFIPYCACGVIVIASPDFGFEALRSFIFVFVLVAFAVLGTAFLMRLERRPLPAPLAPTLAIVALPMSMAACSYIALNGSNHLIIGLLVAASQIIFVAVLVRLPSIVAQGFELSMAALTFSFVTTAAAAVGGLPAIRSLGLGGHIVCMFFAYLEVIFALIVVLSIGAFFIRYLVREARLSSQLTAALSYTVEA